MPAHWPPHAAILQKGSFSSSCAGSHFTGAWSWTAHARRSATLFGERKAQSKQNRRASGVRPPLPLPLAHIPLGSVVCFCCARRKRDLSAGAEIKGPPGSSGGSRVRLRGLRPGAILSKGGAGAGVRGGKYMIFAKRAGFFGKDHTLYMSLYLEGKAEDEGGGS